MSGQPPRLLYVEDDEGNQLLMRSLLRKRPDVELVVAGDGATALSAAAEKSPGLILLDRNLGDMSASQFLPLLWSRHPSGSIPVIIVSGDTGAPRAEDIRLGVVDYVTKPFDVSQVLGLIDAFLGVFDDDPMR